MQPMSAVILLAAKIRQKNFLEDIMLVTSNNHRLESAGLNALEELLRCWECTEKIVKTSMCILKLDVFGYFAQSY